MKLALERSEARLMRECNKRQLASQVYLAELSIYCLQIRIRKLEALSKSRLKRLKTFPNWHKLRIRGQ